MSNESVFQPFPKLETERLILRQIYPTDAEAVFAVLSDQLVREYYGDDPFPAVNDALDQIEVWDRIFNNR